MYNNLRINSQITEFFGNSIGETIYLTLQIQRTVTNRRSEGDDVVIKVKLKAVLDVEGLDELDIIKVLTFECVARLIFLRD